MSFISFSFLAFFAVLFCLYYVIPRRFQWMLLLLGSYVFYLFGGVQYIGYILVTTLSTYLLARRLGTLHASQDAYLAAHKKELDREAKKAYKAGVKRRMWKWLLLGLFLNFGILAVIKYLDFGIQNLNAILGLFGAGQLGLFRFALPLGISFYTFQSMGYLIDVYRGKTQAEKNLGKFALFVSFFPQILQGPISRFDQLAPTLFAEHAFDSRNVSFGLQRMLWGFFKKVVIADRVAVAVQAIVTTRTDAGDPAYTGLFVLLGLVLYAIQIYGDFTGGIDITIGMAQMLGVKLPENFERPYFSKSIAEYWRRWHMTLGEWFKDYLFYPLSICRPMMKLANFSRRKFGDKIGKRVTVYISTLAVWFTTGLWHGAAWNFVVWGLLNGVIILISYELEPLYRRFHAKFHVEKHFAYRLFQVGRTFLLMGALRMLDVYHDVGLTFRMLGSIFTAPNFAALGDAALLEGLGLTAGDVAVVALGVVVMLAVSLAGRRGSVRVRLAARPFVLRYCLFFLLTLVILVFGAYGIGYNASDFIYSVF